MKGFRQNLEVLVVLPVLLLLKDSRQHLEVPEVLRVQRHLSQHLEVPEVQQVLLW